MARLYILRWGVNPSHITESELVSGYRKAIDAYATKYEEAVDGEFPVVVLVKLEFDHTGFVCERIVKMQRGLTVEQVQMIQDGSL